MKERTEEENREVKEVMIKNKLINSIDPLLINSAGLGAPTKPPSCSTLSSCSPSAFSGAKFTRHTPNPNSTSCYLGPLCCLALEDSGGSSTQSVQGTSPVYRIPPWAYLFTSQA
ncbi:hypothetical protein MHYP_G00058030 [Metynnis hypsauchen]